MDDIAEQHDISREITDAISNNVAFPNDIDEDELEKELEELEQVCFIERATTERSGLAIASFSDTKHTVVFAGENLHTYTYKNSHFILTYKNNRMFLGTHI